MQSVSTMMGSHIISNEAFERMYVSLDPSIAAFQMCFARPSHRVQDDAEWVYPPTSSRTFFDTTLDTIFITRPHKSSNAISGDGDGDGDGCADEVSRDRHLIACLADIISPADMSFLMKGLRDSGCVDAVETVMMDSCDGHIWTQIWKSLPLKLPYFISILKRCQTVAAADTALNVYLSRIIDAGDGDGGDGDGVQCVWASLSVKFITFLCLCTHLGTLNTLSSAQFKQWLDHVHPMLSRHPVSKQLMTMWTVATQRRDGLDKLI